MVNSVMLLLQRADATILDDDGKTAYDLAQSSEIRGLFPAPRGLSAPAPAPAPANPDADARLLQNAAYRDIDGVTKALNDGANVNVVSSTSDSTALTFGNRGGTTL